MQVNEQTKNRFTQRIPFAGTPLYRDTSAKDQRYTNILIEKIRSPLTGNDKVYVVKRPGLAANTQPPGGNATPRGIYYWDASGKLYTVFDNKIYAATTDLGVTLDASTGKCWFAETNSGFGGGQRLLVSDGTKLYAIQTDNTITTISTSSDADFPTANLGCIVLFDNYLFFAKSDGTIWNSDVDSFSAYTSTSFLEAEMFSDTLMAISRQKDHLVAFGFDSIEFFWDAENTNGSPLQRRANMALQIGLLTSDSLAQQEDTIAFVGRAKGGLFSVWLMTGLEKIKRISTQGIERVISVENALTSCTAYLIRLFGKFLYVLNLPTINRTLVYNIVDDHWSEWTDSGGGTFDGAYATSSQGNIYMQDNTNGRTYTFSPTTYQDNGSNFDVTLLTDKYDFGNGFQKFCSRLEIIGDTASTGNIAVSYSDDDYANFSTARNVDMTATSKMLTQWGSFRRRAWKFVYTANAPLRLEGFDLDLRQGIR